MAELLDRILDFDNVKAAWEHSRGKGQTPGVDDWSLRRFGRNWEENLRGLIADVRANRYQPKKLRVRYVPKRSGGQRRLGIPTLRDRILQRAALQVLEWRWERKFLQCSYGYRPKRSLFKAVGAVIRYRDRGLRWLLDADIDECFDSLSHEVLWPLIEKEVWEAPVLRLLEQWLEVGMVDRKRRLGLSQGMPVSPLLCNVYLHEFDWRMARGRRPLVRYADDFIILAPSEVQAAAAKGLTAVWLEELRLTLEPAKTRITSFDEGFQFLGVHFQGDSYRYTWEGREIEVSGGMGPLWSLWEYFPHGYDP